MIELTMYNVLKHYGDNFILNNATFTVYEGEKAGIVGANGCGKTTILKLLAGLETMDVDYRKICEGKSRILITKGATLAYLDQLPAYPDGSRVTDILNQAFLELSRYEVELKSLEQQMGHLQGEELERALKQYSRLQHDYEARGGYDRDEKLSKVCTGLKFDEVFLQKDFNILSGGEKTTVTLGRILLESPDILLLDEPTNHLDMDSVEWLEKYLKSYRGIVIIVSHDRYFLDNVVSKIIEVENRECESYKGNYSDYVKQKEENMLLQFERYREQKKKINSMENAIKDLRDWAQRADNNKFFRRAASMQKMLDRMERVEKPVFDKESIKINFRSTERSGYETIKVFGASKGFGSNVILDGADLYVTLGERVALIGPNGCGKTTFLKMLLGETEADSGKIQLGANVKVAYLPQIVTFGNEEATVLECFRDGRIILEGKAREYLSRFMFFGKDPYKKVKQLSGGEKVRLKLSMLLYEETNLLVLDEPTNHLDIDSIETLEEALEDFKGTILFISHDRYFINKVCSRIVAIEDRKFADYPGSYDDYKNRKNERCQAAEPPKQSRVQKPVRDAGADEARKREQEKSRLLESIKQAEGELGEIDEKMSIPGIGHVELNALYSRREELSQELDKMMAEWISAN